MLTCACLCDLHTTRLRTGGGPPPPDFIVGENEIYKRKYSCGPFLVHKALGTRPPPTPLLSSKTSLATGPGGGGRRSPAPPLWATQQMGRKGLGVSSAIFRISEKYPNFLLACLQFLMGHGQSCSCPTAVGSCAATPQGLRGSPRHPQAPPPPCPSLGWQAGARPKTAHSSTFAPTICGLSCRGSRRGIHVLGQ